MPRFFSKSDKHKRQRTPPSLHIHPLAWLGALLLIACDRSMYTALTLAAALLHEIGHIAAAAMCGSEIKSISIYPLGADIRMSQAKSYIAEIIIDGAGIAVNLLLFIISKAIPQSDIASYFAICNISLATINALPVRSLDGGEMLSCVLMLRTEPDKAEKISGAVSFCAVFIMWIAAVYIFFYFDGNPSLFLLAVYLFITVFLKSEGAHRK